MNVINPLTNFSLNTTLSLKSPKIRCADWLQFIFFIFFPIANKHRLAIGKATTTTTCKTLYFCSTFLNTFQNRKKNPKQLKNLICVWPHHCSKQIKRDSASFYIVYICKRCVLHKVLNWHIALVLHIKVFFYLYITVCRIQRLLPAAEGQGERGALSKQSAVRLFYFCQ